MSSAASSARFSGLINPIRDLALNWDVDIAHTLEDYLDELEHIRLPRPSALPPSSSALQSLNFAEAALLIQGSTCVYSKKVEHLHNLVFQALELVSAQHKDGSERKDKHGNVVGGSAAGMHDDEAYLWGDDASFLLLDDVAVLQPAATSLTLPPSSTSSHQQHLAEIDNDFLTNEDENRPARRMSNGKRLSLASDISRSSRSSIVLMNSILHDDHSFGGGRAGSSSLKMASCAMNSDGALVFASSSSEQQNALRSARSSLLATKSGEDDVTSRNALGDLHNDDDDDHEDYMVMGDEGGNDFSEIDNELPSGETVVGNNMDTEEFVKDVVPDGTVVENDRNHLESRFDISNNLTPKFNPLALLDPYDVDSSGNGRLGVSRPVKTDRRTFRLPPAQGVEGGVSKSKKRPAASSLRSSNTVKPITSLHEFHNALSHLDIKSTAGGVDKALSFSAAALCKPSNLFKVSSSFQNVLSRRARVHSLFDQEGVGANIQESQERNRANDVSRQQQFYGDGLVDGPDYDNGYFDTGGVDDFDDNDDVIEEDEAGGGFAFPRLSSGGVIGAEEIGDASQFGGGEEAQLTRRVEAQLALNEALGNGGGVDIGGGSGLSFSSGYTNTFENLCRQHISRFMKGAEDYARETNLSRRVNAWTLRLEPLLLEQESRPAFDIHEYSDKALLLVSNKVHVQEKDVHSTEESDDDSDGDEDSPESGTVQFSDVVVGKSSTEVCRIFLACLQLANLGNLSFAQASTDDVNISGNKRGRSAGNHNDNISKSKHIDRDISDFSVHLIDGVSNRLDIDTYRAPSALPTQPDTETY